MTTNTLKSGCPKCGQVHSGGDGDFGIDVRCQKCGMEFEFGADIIAKREADKAFDLELQRKRAEEAKLEKEEIRRTEAVKHQQYLDRVPINFASGMIRTLGSYARTIDLIGVFFALSGIVTCAVCATNGMAFNAIVALFSGIGWAIALFCISAFFRSIQAGLGLALRAMSED